MLTAARDSLQPMAKTPWNKGNSHLFPDTKYSEYRDWLDSFDVPPPAGEISKSEVMALRNESARLGRLIELIAHGTVAKNHPLFPKLRDYKAALDHLAATAEIADVKGMILAMMPFETEWIKLQKIDDEPGSAEDKNPTIAALGLPFFFHDIEVRLHRGMHDDPAVDFPVLVDDIYRRYVSSLAGGLPADLFEYEYLKVEDERTLVNETAADVFVLFPAAMTARVKTLDLLGRQRILVDRGDLLNTPAKFSGIFAEEPDEHPDYVIGRYQANKAVIDAKYSELIQWHLAQPAE